MARKLQYFTTLNNSFFNIIFSSNHNFDRYIIKELIFIKKLNKIIILFTK